MLARQRTVEHLLTSWLEGGLLTSRVNHMVAELREPQHHKWTWYTKLCETEGAALAEALVLHWVQTEKLHAVAAGFQPVARGLRAMAPYVRVIGKPSDISFMNLSGSSKALILINPTDYCQQCPSPRHAAIFGRDHRYSRLGLRAIILAVDTDNPDNNRIGLVLPYDTPGKGNSASFICVELEPCGPITVHTREVIQNEDSTLLELCGIEPLYDTWTAAGGSTVHPRYSRMVYATQENRVPGEDAIELIRDNLSNLEEYLADLAVPTTPFHEH